MKKTLAIMGAVTAVGLSAAAGASAVSAQGDSGSFDRSGSMNYSLGLNLLGLNANATADVDYADKIATNLGMNKTDVQKVLDEYRNVKLDEYRQALSDRLDKAVDSGKLTREKADMILAKFDELRTFMGTLEGKTTEEKQAAIKQELSELRTWADDNNISTSFLKMDSSKYQTQDKSGLSLFNM